MAVNEPGGSGMACYRFSDMEGWADVSSVFCLVW